MKIIIAILALLAVAMCAQTNTVTINRNFINLQATYHYEDPFFATHVPYCNAATENQGAQRYDGLDNFYACMPLTFGRENKCFQDYPKGNTAIPMPIFYDSDQNVRCALVCSGKATGDCGPRADCMILPEAGPQIGVCLYRKK